MHCVELLPCVWGIVGMPGLTCPTWPGVGRLFELLLDPHGHFCRHGAHPSKPRSKISSWTPASPWLPSLGLWRQVWSKIHFTLISFLHRKVSWSWDSHLTASLHFCSCFRSNKIVLSMRGLSKKNDNTWVAMIIAECRGTVYQIHGFFKFSLCNEDL